MICPLNIEINEKVMVDLTRAVNPALILCEKNRDLAALVGEHPAPRIRFGQWSAAGAAVQDELFAVTPKGASGDDLVERNNPEDVSCIFCTSGTIDAASVGVPDKIYGEEVVCYVVAKDPGLTEASLRQHCQQYLPPAKTPKQIFIVTGFAEERSRQDLARQTSRGLGSANETVGMSLRQGRRRGDL